MGGATPEEYANSIVWLSRHSPEVRRIMTTSSAVSPLSHISGSAIDGWLDQSEVALMLEAFGRKYIFSGDVQKNNNTDENQRSAAGTDLDTHPVGWLGFMKL